MDRATGQLIAIMGWAEPPEQAVSQAAAQAFHLHVHDLSRRRRWWIGGDGGRSFQLQKGAVGVVAFAMVHVLRWNASPILADPCSSDLPPTSWGTAVGTQWAGFGAPMTALPAVVGASAANASTRAGI